ncbi:unnamed protein product [Lepeophtheirus salmonis]|uniref:(salmon louse) hypothetical protein n=1 Tax=Lepeophtheirus salmonis TaxID=72036 RepID=A0A7R8HC32_LEPSM|nr:unnamed protein product [Lepeophtheirus salmonis]CAF2982267.1 unnamed protein product [Lepeophtheirus salmonis]
MAPAEDGTLVPLVKTDFEGLSMKDTVESKIVFKLKPLHIYCKGGVRQRVRLAAQVLSNTVAKAFTIHSQIKEERAKEKRSTVGVMKRMIILEFGKNCETLVSNPAVQIEKEYGIYRIEDEEQKKSVTKISSKMGDRNFQGLGYVSSFIAQKMKLLHPDLGKKTSDIYLNDHGLTPWIYHLSRGGLMVPSDYFLKASGSFRPEVQGIQFTSIGSSSKSNGTFLSSFGKLLWTIRI